jgi:hypothetical protein
LLFSRYWSEGHLGMSPLDDTILECAEMWKEGCTEGIPWPSWSNCSIVNCHRFRMAYNIVVVFLCIILCTSCINNGNKPSLLHMLYYLGPPCEVHVVRLSCDELCNLWFVFFHQYLRLWIVRTFLSSLEILFFFADLMFLQVMEKDSHNIQTHVVSLQMLDTVLKSKKQPDVISRQLFPRASPLSNGIQYLPTLNVNIPV